MSYILAWFELMKLQWISSWRLFLILAAVFDLDFADFELLMNVSTADMVVLGLEAILDVLNTADELVMNDTGADDMVVLNDLAIVFEILIASDCTGAGDGTALLDALGEVDVSPCDVDDVAFNPGNNHMNFSPGFM